MRTTLPVIIAFLSGIIMVVTFGVKAPQGTILGDSREQLLVWVTIIGGFTILLGVVSITRINLDAVIRKKKDWLYSLLTLISVFVMMVPAMLPASQSSLFGDAEGSINYWLFTYLSTPMMGTMFAILAFYIASAAYRAFRARSAQATLLLITAALVMMWRVPMGEAFLRMFSDAIPELINTYIMGGVNAAVQRGIIIGAALGAASMSLRIILGIERTYMGKG